MSRVAIVQQTPVFLDRAATLAKAVAAIDEAAQAGAGCGGAAQPRRRRPLRAA